MEVEGKDGGGRVTKHQTLEILVHHAGREEPSNEFNMRGKKIILSIRITT